MPQEEPIYYALHHLQEGHALLREHVAFAALVLVPRRAGSPGIDASEIGLALEAVVLYDVKDEDSEDLAGEHYRQWVDVVWKLNVFDVLPC